MKNLFLILFLYYDVPENIQIQGGHQTPSWKSTFLTIFHRMLCNMSFKGFSSMQNPILMLFLSFGLNNILLKFISTYLHILKKHVETGFDRKHLKPVQLAQLVARRLGLCSGICRFNSRVGTFCQKLSVSFERRRLSTSRTLRLSLCRITDHPEMNSAVYCGRCNSCPLG